MNRGFNKFMNINRINLNSILNSKNFQNQKLIFTKLNKQIKNGINITSFPQIREFASSSSSSSFSLSSLLQSSSSSSSSKRNYYKNNRNTNTESLENCSLGFKNGEWDQEKKDKYYKSAKKSSSVIYAIIGINVAVWMFLNSDDSYSFQRMIGKNFMLSLDNFKSQPITLLTSMFAHTDGFHLLMFALYSLGPNVLYSLGSSAFFGMYMGAGILSGVGFLAVQKFYNSKNYHDQKRLQNTRALGASGAISGVLMLFACLYPRMTLSIYGIIPVPAALLVSAYFAYDLYNEVYRKQTGVCHVGHLCGGLYGLGYYLANRRRF
ncbi:hypothetical protein ACTFIW_007252 [Dictyostelium discoideum]